ncbi:MAG: S8 family serine peptidase, partial [bacterium]|nr:S8 family serine peptidase [bacterium]
KYDMWCADIEWYYGDWYPVENNVHPLVKFTDGSHSNYILDESASSAVITVGGWVSQNQWQTVGGGTENYPEGYILGAITNHSGPGPARNGVVKPDVAAPSTVMASLCQYYWFWAGNLIHVDGKHAILSGTSTSTPVVSGGIALILEKYPNSSLEQVRQMLRRNAGHDSFTSEYGPNAFGYGKFKIPNLNDKPVAVISAEKIGNTIVFDAAASYDPEEFPLTYRFKVETKHDQTGPKPKNYTYTINGSQLVLTADPDCCGFYRVKLKVNDSIDNSRKVYSQWIRIKK